MVFNTLTRQKEVFEPIEAGKVRFYSCGPTVWNLVHVGNLRSALVADLFFRCWQKFGFEVRYARNYTDVDDKIIKAAKEKNQDPFELAEHFVEEVEKDFRAANILEPSYKPRVTQHMKDIISMIERIQEQKASYEQDGNVLFSVSRFRDYGKLSGKRLEDLMVGARVEKDESKQDPLDFYLWKRAKAGEPSWESPWGAGRPGWHIECSAMIKSLLGDQIDVHHGGVDLVFPHHENEIAQSESGNACRPFSKYWMHHAFVTINEEKMSKSLGNTFLAREFIDQFGGEVARALMLFPHYRSPIDFSSKSISTAVDSLERLYETKDRAEALLKQAQSGGAADSEMEKAFQVFEEKALEALADDFHTPKFCSSFFEMLRVYNRLQYNGEAAQQSLHAEMFLKLTKVWMSDVLGLGGQESSGFLAQLKNIRKRIEGLGAESSGGVELRPEEIERLVEEREQARKAKNFKRSDEIREQLAAAGIEIKDTPTGPRWT